MRALRRLVCLRPIAGWIIYRLLVYAVSWVVGFTIARACFHHFGAERAIRWATNVGMVTGFIVDYVIFALVTDWMVRFAGALRVSAAPAEAAASFAVADDEDEAEPVTVVVQPAVYDADALPSEAQVEPVPLGRGVV